MQLYVEDVDMQIKCVLRRRYLCFWDGVAIIKKKKYHLEKSEKSKQVSPFLLMRRKRVNYVKNVNHQAKVSLQRKKLECLKE